MKVNRFLGILFLLSAIPALAQQESQFTQYMYDTGSINPAYAGTRGVLSINGIYRNQWQGMAGAPETMALSLNSPVGIKGLGIGASFLTDKIGPVTESTVSANFSYSIQVSREAFLSFGIKAGLNMMDVDANKLDIYDPSDTDLFSVNLNSPMAGVGLYLHSEKWYLGLSTPNLLETKHYDEVQVSTATEKAHLYFLGGYVFHLNRELKLKPAMMLKLVDGAPLAADVSASFLFRERLTLGVNYRYDVNFSGLAGFQISDKMMLGYAYDYDTTALGNYNSGSHEIFLRFELGTRLRSTVNPRFF